MQNFIKFILNYATIIFNTLIIGFLFWYFDKNDTVNIIWLMIIVILGGSVIILLCEILFHYKFQKHSIKLPRLRQFISQENKNDDIYIFEPSDLFSPQICVSLYLSDDYELLVAVGYVDTVTQTTKNLQIKITEFAKNRDSNFLKHNKSHIILKPTIPYYPLSKDIDMTENLK